VEALLFLQENLWWIALVLLALVIFCLAWRANFAYDNFQHHLEQNLQKETKYWATTAEFAKLLSQTFFSGAVAVEKAKACQEAFYAPHKKTVALGKDLLGQASVASIAVVAHEFGHASQAFQSPKMLVKHFKFDRFVGFLGNLNPVLIILATILGIALGWAGAVACLCAIILNFVIAIILKAKTVKLEKDASLRAMGMLEKLAFFSETDLKAIKKFLNSAKRTYTADFLCAVLGWTGLVKRTKFF
jgi:Zn-dependent membrane protease YugP